MIKKHMIVLFLVISILFYFGIYLFSINIIQKSPSENWRGLTVLIWITYILIPAFTVLSGILNVFLIRNVFCILIWSVINSILCGLTLFFVFYDLDMNKKIELIWYCEYSVFIAIVMIIVYLLTLLIWRVILIIKQKVG